MIYIAIARPHRAFESFLAIVLYSHTKLNCHRNEFRNELDLSGCMSVTNKSLEALQENLLFARENKTHLNLLIGGIIIQRIASYVCTWKLHR